MSQKVKEMLSPLKPTKNRIIQMLIYMVYGILADLALEALVWWSGLSKMEGWGRLEVGFPFYAGNSITSIAYDDLILIAVSIYLLLTKRFYKGIGFFLGFYMSTVGNFYGVLGIPKPEGM